MRAKSLGVVLGLAACAPEERPAPVAYELRAVVAPALEALAGEASPSAAVAGTEAPSGDELEEVLGPLRSSDAAMRALALEDARSLSPDLVAQLVPALSDERETLECRAGVAEILAAHATPAALEALCAAMETASDAWLRAQCAYRLGQTGVDSVLPRLLLRLKYEKDYETAFWVADACSRLGHLAGLEAMFVVWNASQDELLRARLSQRTSELATERGLEDPNELLARWNAGTLAPNDPPYEPSARLRLEAWRRIRDLREWNLRIVDDARFILAHFEGWVVPLLVEALHESELYVRIHSAQCLERMGPRAAGALGALIAALEEPRTAPAAAAALGAIGAQDAAGVLERCLDEKPDLELRVAAANALGALAAPSSSPSLRRAFDPAQPFDLRQAAAAGLARIDESPDALAFLIECLTDERGDAGAAENALESWIARCQERDPACASAWERWRTLAPAPGTLPDEAELRQRHGERAVLVRELLAAERAPQLR